MASVDSMKAVISLTSWRERIATVGLTIFSILTHCPGFHVVLCLSSDEFPQKEAGLPRDLAVMAANNIIEILWVKENYKAFKKVLFTMKKYHDVPVISADDDLIYCKNYADVLYDKWQEMPTSCIGLSSTHFSISDNFGEASLWGYAQLFPPGFHRHFDFSILDTIRKLGCIDDDGFYTEVRKRFHISAYSFQLPFNNEYIAGNTNASQENCITTLRRTHAQNDREIFRKLLQ